MTRPAIAVTFSLMIGCLPVHALADDASSTSGIVKGALDGKAFVSTIMVDQYDRPFQDRLVFKDGAFFSEECQRQCDFGWEDYYTRVEGDSIAFVVDMVCEDAPQSVRWEGRVTGDQIEGTAVWKVERFYWTVERHATFSGSLDDAPEEQAAILAE